MTFTPEDHTFVLCAYGQSPYLEECLRSLAAQRVRTRCLIAAAAPSPFLEQVAARAGVPLRIRNGEPGIGADWNFALSVAGTPLVTLAHQDDLYDPGYTEALLADLNAARDPILWFCDYAELRNGQRVADNRNLRIKRMLLSPLRLRPLWNSRFVRRRILSLGCSICCPAVTYVRSRVGENPFSTQMKVALDWDQWEKQSRRRGAFCYRPRVLMQHRVHEASATTAMIADHRRREEDAVMFRRFWPKSIARFLERRYARSEDQNQLE